MFHHLLLYKSLKKRGAPGGLTAICFTFVFTSYPIDLRYCKNCVICITFRWLRTLLQQRHWFWPWTEEIWTGVKCIGKYSKLISVLLLTVVMATGCGITDLLGTKNVVAEYEAENYNKDLYTGKLFASDLCVASGDISLSGISSDETNTLHSAALFDVDRKKVDFSYQMFDKIYPASTTKIITALVALENADLSDVVTVSQNADMNSFAADEATCGIKAGDKNYLSDFIIWSVYFTFR